MDASDKGLSKKPKSKKSYSLFFKFLSLLSVVRGYNIALIVLAQYLAAIFIFSPDLPLKSIIFNLDLYFLVLATICVIASGYIINNFYDSKKDRINKPIKSKIDSLVSQKIKLQIYFFLNFVGVLFGLLVSWRAALFFAVYIFLIWLYSHKLKKYPLTGLFSASILSILPFFAIFIYYKNFSEVIFIHAAFLFFVLMIRELLKDLENIKGDIVQDYQTIPIKYGEYFTKALITLLVLLTMNPVYFLWGYPEIGMMKYYFYLVGIIFVFFLFFLWKANSKRDYVILHNVIKLVILVGVLSILLIDTSVIIKRIINV
ncbi:geranylgeranylglycerol-phosphate geranylgeranyltransferase [Lutimonas saemankumensis]|uniref:geranylgeranylglycerol-phosphate geranylgeranyltransferase n=1 Tax=Lutimonas saemankumensis TaxID=483016 RepID=UPI001CD3703C|nr:geranylgeranylglycerol-phosphate geranylgeranyltransferase [Lutimonas saemankumensis]MCA0932753.1 geranylgeranylglycerol-phosphate geranylgeranyltransferase [Lutimonas saemankumensis]